MNICADERSFSSVKMNNADEKLIFSMKMNMPSKFFIENKAKMSVFFIEKYRNYATNTDTVSVFVATLQRCNKYRHRVGICCNTYRHGVGIRCNVATNTDINEK